LVFYPGAELVKCRGYSMMKERLVDVGWRGGDGLVVAEIIGGHPLN